MRNICYVNHNRKALNVIVTYANLIFTYFNADPRKVKYNHIITIPAAQRSEANGSANFRLDICDFAGKIRHFNTRIETCVFQSDLIIEATKVHNLFSSDLLIFPSPNGGVYMSIKDGFGHHSWLTKDAFFSIKEKEWEPGVIKTYYHYNFINLLTHGQISELLYREDDNKLVIHDNNNYMIPDTEEYHHLIMTKDYQDFKLDFSHITQVQYDGKQAKTIYWCTKADQLTKNAGSSTCVALYLENLSTLDHKNIYQRLMRAYNKYLETGKAYFTKIPLKQGVSLDDGMLDDNGKNIIIYVSNKCDFNVAENATADMKSYQKNYASSKKVTQWIKKHPGSTNFPKKWDEEDLKIAKENLRRF